jgi:hypothetical protein
MRILNRDRGSGCNRDRSRGRTDEASERGAETSLSRASERLLLEVSDCQNGRAKCLDFARASEMYGTWHMYLLKEADNST